MKHAKTQETLYLEAIRLLKENGSASTSFFQRKLCIGYAAAREIFDRMLEEGVAVRKKEFTIVLNKKGEKKMRNTTFNGMEAKDFFDKVIALDAARATEKPSFHKLSYARYLDLAKQGYKEALAHLERIAAKKAEKATTNEKRLAAEAERDFWQTVQFMVAQHYYNLGELSYEKHLGYMLAFGVGCEADGERGASMMLADMSRTLDSLDIDTKDRLVAECVKRGNRCGVLENSILLAVLRWDKEQLDKIIASIQPLGICGEAVSIASGIFYSRLYDAKREGGNL